MAAKYGENQIDQSFNTSVNCKYVNRKEIDDLKMEISSGVEAYNRIITHCFCLKTLIDEQIDGVQKFSVEIDGKQIFACKDWLYLWLQSQSLKIAIIVLVPIINILLSQALECNYNLIFDK